MIKDIYYEEETTWMRLKVPKLGFLPVSRRWKTQQRRDVCFQHRYIIHPSLENVVTFQRHNVRAGSGVLNPPNVMTCHDVATSRRKVLLVPCLFPFSYGFAPISSTLL